MSTRRIQSILWVAAVFLLLAYAINFIYAALSEHDSSGTFGDTFGVVNALFSGSALFFLIQAFLLQREELSIVREERDMTRDVLNMQGEVNRLQEIALKRQIFQQNFFALLDLAMKEREGLRNKKSAGHTTTHFKMTSDAAATFIRAMANEEPIGHQKPLEEQIIKSRLMVQSFVSAYNLIQEEIDSDEDREKFSQILYAALDGDIAKCIFAIYLQMEPNHITRLDYDSIIIGTEIKSLVGAETLDHLTKLGLV